MTAGLNGLEQREAGCIPGIPSIGVYGPFDRDPHFRFQLPSERDPDEDPWEESDGLHTQYTPSALLLTIPDLWDVVHDWGMGLGRADGGLTSEERESLSNREIEALLTMSATYHRRPLPKPEGADGD